MLRAALLGSAVHPEGKEWFAMWLWSFWGSFPFIPPFISLWHPRTDIPMIDRLNDEVIFVSGSKQSGWCRE